MVTKSGLPFIKGETLKKKGNPSEKAFHVHLDREREQCLRRIVDLNLTGNPKEERQPFEETLTANTLGAYEGKKEP